MAMDLNGQNAQIYASGVRNGSGLAFDQSGQLWMTVNQRDDLQPDHTNLPTDEFGSRRESAAEPGFAGRQSELRWPSEKYPAAAGALCAARHRVLQRLDVPGAI
jgi:hypothetical protein